MYTKDYATTLPVTGTNQGINIGLFFFKPSKEEFDALKNTYATSYYDKVNRLGELGGFTGFPGDMKTSSLLAYYYSDQSAIELDWCIYGNSNKNPLFTDG
eukprot:4400582-Ditylum_brightwellii.AAC.1